jgi:hypothetical protein
MLGAFSTEPWFVVKPISLGWRWRQMTQMQNLWHQPWRNTYVQGDAWSWIGSIGLGIAVGVAYLLAAHLSLVC